MSSKTRAILRNIAHENMKRAGITKVNRRLSLHWLKFVPTTSSMRCKAKRGKKQ